MEGTAGLEGLVGEAAEAQWTQQPSVACFQRRPLGCRIANELCVHAENIIEE